MNKPYHIFLFAVIIFCASCTKRSSDTPSKLTSYEEYLNPGVNPEIERSKKEIQYWNTRIEENQNSQITDLQMLTAEQEKLFHISGDIQQLILAEANHRKITERYKHGNAQALRALARNLSTQHKFSEALIHLEKAMELGEEEKETRKMLFDVHFELGNIEEAEAYLESISKNWEFGFHIRDARMKDHHGQLGRAIVSLELALAKAKEMKKPDLVAWSYANLGDFYGHAERIEDSYNAYIACLEIDPFEYHALKGIAWIKYSYEGDYEAAVRITDCLDGLTQMPDPLFLRKEIAAASSNKEMHSQMQEAIEMEISKPAYHSLYANQLVEMALEKGETDFAEELSLMELQNRTCPSAYALRAQVLAAKGDVEAANSMVKESVLGKTGEPASLFMVAKVLKQSQDTEQLVEVKQELMEALYELGPVTAEEIRQL